MESYSLRVFRAEVKSALILLTFIFLGVSSPALAETSSAMDTVWFHTKSTFRDAFDSTGLIILGSGIAATAIATSQDQMVHDAWKNHQRFNADISNIGNYWGTGIVEGALVLGQLIWDTKTGIPALESVLSSQIVGFALKYGVARERPDSDTRTSFPSGHTNISFASATEIQCSYGWKYSLPLYAMGVFTGLTRLSDNAHWLSDVVAGATVGTLFGRAGFKHHMVIEPLAINDGGNGFGLQGSMNF